MLELDLRALEREPRHIDAELPVEGGPWSDTDLAFAEPPSLEVDAVLTGDRGVHVIGVLRATVVQACRRCLKNVETPVEVELDLLFDPGVQKEEEQGQVYALEAEAATLDLQPALREQLLLEVPPYPLCREDCKGLCPRCGADLNEETCDCVLEEPDPRWDALRELQLEE